MNLTFPSIASFEEYENHKLKIEVLENAAREIIHRHHLPAGHVQFQVRIARITFVYTK
jgi:hypothetical protein